MRAGHRLITCVDYDPIVRDPFRRTRWLSLAAAGAVTAGCASVDPHARFGDVQRTLADRLPQQVVWNAGSRDDALVAARVDALLANALDVDAAVQIALLNNQRLQATYESLGIAQADLVAAGLLKNPIFDGSVRFVEGGGSPTVDLAVAFDFLDVFFVGLRKKVATAELDVAQASVTGAVLDLAAETRLAYVDLQAAQQTIELRTQVEQATAVSADLAKRLRDAGNIRALDFLNEQALHEDARLALAAATTEVVERREVLNRLMGLAGDRVQWSINARLPEPTAMDPAPTGDTSSDLERRALDRSLDLQAARAQIDVAFSQLGITRPAGLLSGLELGVNSERQDGRWEVGPSLGVALPIFSQGQPAVARGQALIRRAESRYAATAIDVRSEVRAAQARVAATRAQVDQYRSTMLPLRQSVVEQSQLQYNAMQISAFQLLMAKRDQIEAGQSYVRALRDYWAARTRLEMVLNGRMLGAASATSVQGDH